MGKVSEAEIRQDGIIWTQSLGTVLLECPLVGVPIFKSFGVLNPVASENLKTEGYNPRKNGQRESEKKFHKNFFVAS